MVIPEENNDIIFSRINSNINYHNIQEPLFLISFPTKISF